jgi:hypothetical protein
MLDSETRFIEPHATTGVLNSDAAERPVSFRFSVTWSSLFVPPEALPAPSPTLPTVVPREPLSQVSSTAVARSNEAEIIPAPVRKPGPTVQWEMVVPKMVRSAKPATSRPLPASAPQVGAATAEQIANSQPVPSLYASSPPWFRSFRVKVLLTIAALTALSIPIWKHMLTPSQAPTEVDTAMGAGGWVRDGVSRFEPGYKQLRQLVLYRPSMNAKDCRLEFTWQVGTAGVGWVFRAKDRGNYYAMRIKVVKPGPSPTMSVEHFTVYHGVEGGHSEKVLVFSRNDPVLRIRMEVAGPAFTLYMQGNATEYWNDTRLNSGGLGFFEEWNQGVDVHSVRMLFYPTNARQLGQRGSLLVFNRTPANAGAVEGGA